MSIREQIAHLESLNSIDTDVRRIDEQLETRRGGLTGLQSELVGLEARLKSDREMLTKMERTRSELTTEIRQMNLQVERSREKLARSRNERETNAAQREMEELRKLHRDREEELERLGTALEGARASIEQAEARKAALVAELEGTSEGTTATIEGLEAQKKDLLEQRKQVVAAIPAILYRRYESLRTKRPVAIARCTDGTCQGCHLGIPPMMFHNMLRQDQFEQCPHCRRILYYYAAPAEARDEAQGGAGKTA